MAKGVGAVVGRTRGWLAVGVVTAVVGIALWWSAPATQGGAPGGKAEVAPSAVAATVRANATESRTSQGRPAEVDRVKAFEDLKRRARAGDAVAQRLLAETYEGCYFVNIDRENFMDSLDFYRQMIRAPAQLSVLEQVAAERFAQCGAVDGGAIVPMQLVTGWYAQAAENGDLAARLMDNAFKQKRLDTAEAAEQLEEVLGSNDPAAVFAMGSTLHSNYPASAAGPAAGLMTGEHAGEAWMVAGCRMGYDCGPSGKLMGTLCLVQNACTGEDFEAYLKRAMMNEAQRRDLERRVTEILRLIEA